MSEAIRLVDAEARKRAIGDVTRSCFVEAGAGSGKTRCLVERVLTLLEAGTPSESIAVITFTRKAAGELRDRIRMTLSERLDRTPDHPFLRAASMTLDQMAIETIHSFCRRLLLRYSLEAGLPAGLTVMSDVDEEAALETDARRFAVSAEPEVREALLELLRVGVSATQLDALYRSLWLQPSELPTEAMFDPSAVTRWLAELQCISHECKQFQADKYAKLVREFTGAVVRHLDGPLTADVLRSMPAWPRRNYGARREEIVRIKETMQELKRRWLQEISRSWAVQRLQVVALAMQQHANASHTLRQRTGVLRQDELLGLTMQLLRKKPALREQVRAAYRYLLVDEFQDTDREQVDIIAHIVSSGDFARYTMPVLPEPGPGRLFVVGDYRQAIYGFRGADVSLFEAVRDRMNDDVVQLVTNFRSSWPVVDAVNRLFSMLDETHYPPMASIHLPESATDGLAAAFGQSIAGKVGDVRRQEAEAVVRLVYTELAAGCPPEDIAVLMRDRSILRALEAELEDAGLPYRVESQSLLCATQEYQDIRNLLAAIAFPGDQSAVVAALMGPACGCTLRELQCWRRNGGQWLLKSPLSGDETGRVAASLRRLSEWRIRSYSLSVSAFVEQLVAEAGLMEGCLAHARARESWRRIKLLLQMAQEWDGTGGLPGFVRWLDDLADRQIRQDESVTPDLGMPAIRLLTVHAAKGLEFDTVIVAGFAGKGGPTQYPILARYGRERAWCPGICRMDKSDACEDCPGRRLQLLQKEAADAERLRLLYVACTRARRRLYLSLWSSAAKNDESSLIERVASAWDAAGLGRLDPPELRSAHHDLPGVQDDDGLSLSEWQHKRNIAFQTGQLVIVTPSRLSHTDWAQEDTGSPEWDPLQQGGYTVPLTADQRRALQRGHAVHRTLATVSMPDGSDLERRAIAAARDAGLGDDPETLRLASILLAGVRDLCVNALWKREVYLGLALGEGMLLEGYADLVIDRPDGLIVVDYKTDFLSTEAEVYRRALTYRPQLACYAHALHQLTGRPVSCGYVVFALNGEPYPVRLDGLEPAWNELAAAGFTKHRSG